MDFVMRVWFAWIQQTDIDISFPDFGIAEVKLKGVVKQTASTSTPLFVP